MKDAQILSAFGDLPANSLAAGGRPLVFDACHVGVMLRALLFVGAVVGIVAMYGAGGFMDWLGRAAFLISGGVAATLAWLVVACSLKRVLARLPLAGQQVAGGLLGALAGLYGCGMLVLGGLNGPTPWVASAASGALVASLVVTALISRARGRAPAATAARLAELQARIRPHFLFNTLNSAVALVRQDPARAEAVLEDLADLFRHALAEPGESVTLAQEVALARRYLAIEQVRFGERLRVEWSLDPAADGARVPPLMLQPLVENAVKHGVEPSEAGAQVRISTERRGGTVVLKVTNTVPSGQGNPGLGVAQDNVRHRLELLHDVHAQFRCGMRDGVYQVRLEVPA